MNFKTNLCMFSILGSLAVLTIFVYFGSDFFFPSLKTNPPNDTSSDLSVSGEGQPRALQPNRKGNTEKHDSRTQEVAEVASVPSATLSLSDGESPFHESSDTPIDPALEELSLGDEEYFFEEDYYLLEEILVLEEEQDQYLGPDQEYEMTEEEQEEIEAFLVASSLAPSVEDEPFYEDEILIEEETVIDESVESWQEEQEEY